MLPENACTAPSVRFNVLWVPSPALRPYSEFNPYDPAVNPVDRPSLDGPVVPVPWAEVTAGGSSSRGSSPQNGSIPSDPFSMKRKRWFSFDTVKRFFGLRHTECREKENWILLPNSLARRPHPQSAQEQTGPPDLPISAWKEYGYWARPMVQGVEVRNDAPPAPDHVLQNVNVEEVYKSMIGPRGSPHPENWVPGLRHPSLPPKPPFWKTPTPHEPMPLPWECRLNPFLEHKRAGMPVLYFDMRYDEQSITFATLDSRIIPLMGMNLNQPATYPFVTEMWITAVADDPFPVFPWPVAVYNKRGVLCRDVFHALYQNFQRFLTKQEVNKFPKFKAKLVEEAFNQRMASRQAMLDKEYDDHQDGLRRIDYFADKVMFRGLEPSTDRGGSWILFLGPQGPEEDLDTVQYLPPPSSELRSYQLTRS